MPLESTCCPYCHQKGRPQFSGIDLHFPPMGGDYDWMETDAQAHCPYCQARYEVRVRYNLDLEQVTRIVAIKPLNDKSSGAPHEAQGDA